MTISIIIPTLNRPDQMIRLVDRLALVVNTEEVIVVDDSKDSQAEELKTLAHFDLTYIHRGEKLGVTSARNVGANSAKGDYLLFFDDDDDFTLDWLIDFRAHLLETPDLVFCNMIRVEPDGSKSRVLVSDSQLGAMGNRIVIPGAWIIKKELFSSVAGYDEQLLFAENTEFFLRVFENDPTVSYIDKHNFIYYPCPTGGSKNLQNMIDSLDLILEKHTDTLSDHVKHLYHQIIGVNSMRFRNFSRARLHLWNSIKHKPSKIATWGRFGLACFPFLAKHLYSETVKHD